jgi:hypothetical protein
MLSFRDWRSYTKERANGLLNDKIHEMSNNNPTFDNIQEVYKATLDEIAPIRVIRLKEGQIVNTKIEALKKRRNHYLKKYKKTQNPKHLELAKSFSATIKKTVKVEARRTFQCKAKSKDLIGGSPNKWAPFLLTRDVY